MKKTIKDYDLENKKVIIRVDFNVPIKDGIIIDDTRIRSSLETIQYAINNNAKVILLSHLGRIKEISDLGKNSLAPVAKRLGELLKKEVTFIPKTNGTDVENTIRNMKNRDIVLLENTRFEDLIDKKESSNDLFLAKYWASLGDIYINDAFATIHRSHASNVGIASYLPNGIGFLVEKELKALSTLENANRPYIVILGGSKVSDKIGVIQNLIVKADYLIIGGAMAFTFLKAKKIEVGKSLVEDDYLEYCQELLNEYADKIILPIDLVVSKNISDNSPYETVSVSNIREDDIGLDLGIETINNILGILESAKTVVWNGPLGYYEIKSYQNATNQVLLYLTDNHINTIIGGGDIVAASYQLGYQDKITHISTGGGATLEYLEGKQLPGLEIIDEK